LYVFFLLIYLTFLEGAIGLDFCFLLEVMSEDLIIEMLIRFDSDSFDCFYILKILVDSLILSLGKFMMQSLYDPFLLQVDNES